MSSFFEKYTQSIKSDLGKIGGTARSAGAAVGGVAVDGFKKGALGEVGLLAMGVGSAFARQMLPRVALIPPVAGVLAVAGVGYLALKALQVHDEISAEQEAQAEVSATSEGSDAC